MISQMYKLALAALLGLSLAGCGGGSGSQPEPSASAPQPVRSLHTGRVLLLGGDELFDGLVRRNYGACADNLGVKSGDSASFMSYDAVGALNSYPGTVIIVANAFELTYAEQWRTLENLTAAALHASVSGSRLVIVGVPGALEFNTQLGHIARAYGGTYSDAVTVRCP